MKPTNPESTFEYICRADRALPLEEQTIAVLGYLTASQQELLDDSLGFTQDEKFVFTGGKQNTLALHLGLRDLKNFRDESGNEIRLERDETKKYLPGKVRPIKDEFLDRIPKDVRNEYALAIKQGGELTEAELKNL